jgi:DNA-binding MarR family transcriptional regulator
MTVNHDAAVWHRKIPKKVEPEQTTEIFAARLAKMYNITRDRAGDALDYLQKIGFIIIEQKVVSRKKIARLTDNGRLAATWLEENFSPSLLSYLEKTYSSDKLVRLLRELRSKSEQETNSTPNPANANS